jgi:hypothetical protein
MTDKANIAAAAIAKLEAEKQRRTDEKIAKGEAVRVSLGAVVIGVAGPERAASMLKNARAKKIAELRAAGERREVVFDDVVTTIITGVPRCGRDESADDEAPPIAKAPEDKAPRVEDFHARRKVSDALSAVSKPLPRTPAPRPVESSPDEGPYHIHAQVRGPDERGDPGEIAEGSYTISGGMVRVRDDQNRDLGSEVLRPGDLPAAVARKILREKKAPNDFWGRTLH